MMTCPHSIYFFRGSVDDFGLMDEYKGDKTSYDLTRSPNPLLDIRDNGDYYRTTQEFTTNHLYKTRGVKVKKGEYVKIIAIKPLAYNSSLTYVVGDYCNYNGNNYICKTTISTPEAFNNSKWQVASVSSIPMFDVMGDSFVNTFRDWHIVPLGRPVVAPPEQKTHIIEIPGASGIVDISNSLTKYPIFNNRTGSWTFAILSDETDTPTCYEKILNFLQGSNVKFILEDDPLYYYEGKVYVESISPNSDGTCSEITIAYDLDPYKKSVYMSNANWSWDKFVFGTDEVNPTLFNNLQVPPTNTWKTFDFTDYVGIMPVIPDFNITLPLGGTLYAQLYNQDLGINWKEYKFTSSGTFSFSDLIFCEFTKESKIQMRFRYEPQLSSTGTHNAKISIIFRSGRL